MNSAADNDDDLVAVGIWDGTGLIDPDNIPEEITYKIDYSKMLKASRPQQSRQPHDA